MTTNYWMANYPVQCTRDDLGRYGLGDADPAQQAKDDALAQFDQAVAALSIQVNSAFQRLVQSGATADIVATMSNNIQRLTGIAEQVHAGAVTQIASYGKVARVLIDSMTDMARSGWDEFWGNWNISVEDQLRQLLAIPAMLEAALMAIAKTTGKTIHEVAAGIGVDSSQLPAALDALSNKLIWALFGLGVAYIVVRKVL